jgi:archaeosine-15-forming tRNA-guanine transglycosylase
VPTELEYVLVLARSVFDLQQELIASLWSRRVRVVDSVAEARRKGRALPPSFSRMVLRDKQRVRTSDEIVAVVGLSPQLAAAYARTGTFFCGLREARDGIVHSGKSFDMIFCNGPGLRRAS